MDFRHLKITMQMDVLRGHSPDVVEKAHTSELVDKFYGGSNLMFLSSFVRSQGMSPKELNELRSFINNWSKGGD